MKSSAENGSLSLPDRIAWTIALYTLCAIKRLPDRSSIQAVSRLLLTRVPRRASGREKAASDQCSIEAVVLLGEMIGVDWEDGYQRRP